MTDPERSKILQMIDEGKITPEEGLRLMQVLKQEPVETEIPVEENEPQSPPPPPGTDHATSPELEKTVKTARSLWMIPTGLGVAILILGAWVIMRNLQASGANAWFFCLGLPLFVLGILVTIWGASARTSRWLFVSVKQQPGDFPRHILIGFPLPLKLTSWFFRTFGHRIKEIGNAPVDLVVDALAQTSSPLVVNVDEGESGEKVQVFIG